MLILLQTRLEELLARRRALHTKYLQLSYPNIYDYSFFTFSLTFINIYNFVITGASPLSRYISAIKLDHEKILRLARQE